MFAWMRWKNQLTRFLLLAAAVLALLAFAPVAQVFAGVVVGTGTPESCTEEALDAAMMGGGTVTFNCGADDATINITTVKIIESDLTMDGDGNITLHAQNVNHFKVKQGVTLTLDGMILENGSGSGAGAIDNNGKTILQDTTIKGTTSGDGAIRNDKQGTLDINHGTFTNNHSTNNGGAINSRGSIKIRNSTFAKNRADKEGGAIYMFDGPSLDIQRTDFTQNTAKSGGAMLVYKGNAKIKHSTFVGNVATTTGGGAIHNRTNMVLLNSVLKENSSKSSAGAIINYGNLELRNTTVSNNTTPGAGGGISNYQSVTVDRSTISGNSSGFLGGGIYNSGSATITNSTFSGNRIVNGFNGAAIYISRGEATLTYVTIALNKSSRPGAIDMSDSGASLVMEDSILAQNEGNCGGHLFRSKGDNISDDSTCKWLVMSGDRQNTDLKLGPLADNGGPTWTHLPASDSPALAHGSPVPGITTDQRGVARPAKHPDVGSVEVPTLN